MRSFVLFLALLLTACAPTGPASMIPDPSTPNQRYEFSQIHMGVRANIIIYSDDEQTARRAARAAFAQIARLDSIMSDYRVDSELNRLSDAAGHGWVPISKDLYDVLNMAQYISQQTNGAFDVTVGPATQLWRQMRRTKTFPSSSLIKHVRDLVNYTNLHLDNETQSAKLDTPGMRLDLGGIAKGYALDRASQVLLDNGCPFHLVALAGDIVVRDGPPEKTGWRIAIDPRAVSDTTDTQKPFITLQNSAISTSGDVNQFIAIDGTRYSHIVDPRTGLGSPRRTSATVVGPVAALTDPLATALTLMPTDDAVQIVESLDLVAARIETLGDDGFVTIITTSRWPDKPDHP